MSNLFSYFLPPITNTHPIKTVGPGELWDEITSDRHKALTERIRATTNDAERRKLKALLPYVTPAGCFVHPRRDKDLIVPSNMVVMDYDNVPSVPVARAVLMADEVLAGNLMLMFTSPTGNGIKAFLRTDPDETHLANFRNYTDYLSRKYRGLGLEADESGKNLSRLCYVPHDPTAYLHPSFGGACLL